MKRVRIFWVSLIAGVCLGAVAFWRITHDNLPVLVCLGDSLTSCGGADGKYTDYLQRMMPHLRVINAGVSGDTLEGARKRYRVDVLKEKPDVVIVALGANDFWRNTRSVAEMRDDLVTMVADFKRSGAQIIVAGCFGERDYWGEHSVEFDSSRFDLAWRFAQMERAVAREYGCFYLPNMQTDIKPNRLKPYWDMTDHPNPAGNHQVALRLMPYIKEALR